MRNRKITAAAATAAAADDSVAALVAAHFAGLLLRWLLMLPLTSLSLSLCGSLKVGRCLRFHQQKWLMQMDLSRAFVIQRDRKDIFSKITVTRNFGIRSTDNKATD